MNLPRSRNTDVVVNELGDELLVYDLTIHKAYNLNRTSSIVYQACGDGLTFDELKKKHKFTDDLIYLALDELKENNLLENTDYTSSLTNLSRREAIRKVGLASMIALPLISSLVAPKAVDAQSSAGRLYSTCTTSADCGSSAPSCNTISRGSQAGSNVCCITLGGQGTGSYSQGNIPGTTDCSQCRNLIQSRCCSGSVSGFGCASGGNGIICDGFCT